MSLKVIGTGFGRTGTNSLKLALEQLGFGPCHHMFEVYNSTNHLLPIWQRAAHQGVMPDWAETFRGFRATVDWPSAFYWKELVDFYPEAKVVHTTRTPESWIASVHGTIYASMRDRAQKQGTSRAISTMAWDLIVMRTFDGRMDDTDYAAEVFKKHDEEVRSYVAPERLLLYEVSQGWPPLCAHLGVAVPDAPFPKSNSTQDFQKESAERHKKVNETS